MKPTKEGMPETMYRASRCCRVLGNPTAYLLLRCIGRERKTPSELSDTTRISLTTVSMTLRHLRELDLVRYEALGTRKLYWVKDPGVLDVLDSLEGFVERMRKKEA